MEEQLISFETAKLAKEKGFTYAYEFYDKEGNIVDFGIVGGWTDCHDENYAAPTQSLLQKWLREKHDIHFEIKPIFDVNEIRPYHISISKNFLNIPHSGKAYKYIYLQVKNIRPIAIMSYLKFIPFQ